MLRYDPQQRITAHEALQHDFFRMGAAAAPTPNGRLRPEKKEASATAEPAEAAVLGLGGSVSGEFSCPQGPVRGHSVRMGSCEGNLVSNQQRKGRFPLSCVPFLFTGLALQSTPSRLSGQRACTHLTRCPDA